MLKYTFKKMFSMRGVQKPYTWLRKIGFSRGLASKISTEQCKKLSEKHLTLLCLSFNCTPDDMMEWVMPGNEKLNPRKAVHALHPSKDGVDAAKLLWDLPAKQLKKLAIMLRKEEDEEG